MKLTEEGLLTSGARSFPRIIAAIVLGISSWAMLSGCATTTSGGAVGGDRKQLLLVSSQELDQMAAQSYTKLKADSAGQGTLNKDPALLARVNAIAGRLEPQTRIFRPDAPGWKWEVNVITSDQINAFCMPGGKIMVYSGLAKKLNLSDEELAVVIGHEMSHALREHSREQVSQAVAAQTVIGVGAALLGLGEGSAKHRQCGLPGAHRNAIQPHRRERSRSHGSGTHGACWL